MQKFYYVTPNYSVAHNAKVGTTSMARAIIQTYYPELIPEVQRMTDNGIGDWRERGFFWQFFCPKEIVPTKPVVLLVRHPILRLKSALMEAGITDYAGALRALRDGERWQFDHLSDSHELRNNPHFLRQSDYIYGQTHLFKFPDHLQDVINFLGLQVNFPNMNQRDYDFNLPQVLQTIANNFYYQDIQLYDQITQPNTILNSVF